MGAMIYANFSLRNKEPEVGVSDRDFKAFSDFWESQFDACWTDNPPEYYQHYAHDGMVVYARADVGRHFKPESFLEFTKVYPHLQMEIIEEDYDEDRRCRYLLEGELFEKLPEVRYYEKPKLIDWPD